MRTLPLLAFMLVLWDAVAAQEQAQPKPKLSFGFVSIIVADLDKSLDWYTKVLGFAVKNRIENEARGFKIANLRRTEYALELIELKKAVALNKALPNFNPKTRIQGFFKVGFQVSHFDQWLQHLRYHKVSFYGKVVTDPVTQRRMVIVTDPDNNRVQFFETSKG